jgi:hypothetical protein
VPGRCSGVQVRAGAARTQAGRGGFPQAVGRAARAQFGRIGGPARRAGNGVRAGRTEGGWGMGWAGGRGAQKWREPAALTQPKSQAARRSRVCTPGSGRRRAPFLYNGVAPGISPMRPASPPARAPCVNKHIQPAAVSLRSASRARSLSLGRWRVTKEGARGLGTGSSQQRSSDHYRHLTCPQVGTPRRARPPSQIMPGLYFPTQDPIAGQARSATGHLFAPLERTPPRTDPGQSQARASIRFPRR